MLMTRINPVEVISSHAFFTSPAFLRRAAAFWNWLR
jgi:hypothetical protein